ncbi:unnamed protein product [Urochloa decumbens]|uniref:Uncharacterized protein n=1 Tax=Urochloa decumbens TaxID=240449 RepID=A0ABC9DMC3_9POAL
MAEHRGAAREHQPEQPPIELLGVLPAPDHRRNQQLCLDAGRALVLCGVFLVIPTAFGPADDGAAAAAAANKRRALLGFVAWILGVCLCLLGLTPAAPWVARAGAAVATTVLKFLSPPV